MGHATCAGGLPKSSGIARSGARKDEVASRTGRAHKRPLSRRVLVFSVIASDLVAVLVLSSGRAARDGRQRRRSPTPSARPSGFRAARAWCSPPRGIGPTLRRVILHATFLEKQ